MINTLGFAYFGFVENYRDWLRMLLAITYIVSECFFPNSQGERMMHFNDKVYYTNFNFVNV